MTTDKISREQFDAYCTGLTNDITELLNAYIKINGFKDVQIHIMAFINSINNVFMNIGESIIENPSSSKILEFKIEMIEGLRYIAEQGCEKEDEDEE